jgi:hypothetical protein
MPLLSPRSGFFMHLVCRVSPTSSNSYSEFVIRDLLFAIGIAAQLQLKASAKAAQ